MNKTKIPTKQELEEVYNKKGMSIKKVAKELKKGHTFIWELMKEYDIPVKDRAVYKNINEQIEAKLKQFKNQNNRELVKEWIDERKNTKSLEYIRQRVYTFHTIISPLKKDITDIIKNEDKKCIRSLLDFLAKKNNGRVRVGYRIHLKAFFKWANDDQHPKCTKWIDTKKSLDELKAPIQTLTDEERKAIIDNAPTQRDRLIFQILNENPTRPRDIINLKIKDVVADEFGYELHFHSKTQTGFRTIRLINSVPDMRLYLSTHKFRDDDEAPLFYSLANRDKSDKPNPLQIWGMSYALREACERTGIKRRVTLYYFRKTVTSELLQDPRYTPKEVQVMGGWSSIKLLDTYGVGVTADKVNEKKLQVSGLKKHVEAKIKENNFKPTICPRCQTENPNNVDSCGNCWLPLTRQAIEKITVANKVRDKAGLFVTREQLKDTVKEMLNSGEIKV